MNSAIQTAIRFREVVLSGTWVANTNFKAQLTGMTWQQATQQVGDLNTIAILTSHVHYYIAGILNVLEGGTLDIRDKYSFDFPPLGSQADWDAVTDKLWQDAERFASLVEVMSEEQMADDFAGLKYGSNQRNIDAMIEHAYYHLGQVVLLKKLITQ